MSRPLICVVGCGSVGKRHTNNLVRLGCDVVGVDPRADRRGELMREQGVRNTYDNFESATRENSVSATVIASPPVFHVQQVLDATEQGHAILLEKPIGKTLEESLHLRACDTDRLLLGYTWRWSKALRAVYEHVIEGTLGNIYYASFFMSANLEDWHPWERYQDFFMASKELGGGALLDESHWIDQMLWMFGLPESVFSLIDRVSELDITADDSVDMLANYNSGLKVYLHLDLYGRPHEKSIKIVGEKGVLSWDEKSNVVRTSAGQPGNEIAEQFDEVRNDMFIAVAAEFLKIIRGGRQIPMTCSLEDGLNVMSVIESARLSATTGSLAKVVSASN